METFMAIVFLVFGILQIILFFKIWGMTNNVKKIKEAFLEKDFPAEYLLVKPDLVKDAFYANIRKIDKLIYLEDKEAARRMLLSMKYDLESCRNSADKYVEKEVLELSEPLFKKNRRIACKIIDALWFGNGREDFFSSVFVFYLNKIDL